MRALVVTTHGGPEVLQVRQLPVPQPGPGQVLVRVVASGVNFKDVYERQGIYRRTTPFVLGDECAGEVTALGEGVRGFAVGDHVASAKAIGSHAEYALAAADALVPVPAGVDLELAAAVLLQGMTAHYLVHSTYPVAAGDTVLVHAAAGGTGRLIVQLAVARGATVVATVGSAEKVEVARAAGAQHVIRSDQADDLAAAVREVATDGVDVVYDGVGKATFDASLATLRRRGLLVLFGGASGQVPPFDLQRLNSAGSLYVTRPTLADYVATREELLERAGDLYTGIGAGTLQVAVGGHYPLDDAARAYGDLEGRATTGKLLLVP